MEKILVKLIVQKKALADQLSQIIDTTEGFKTLQGSGSQPPGLIIFELSQIEDFSNLQALMNEEGTDEIFLVADSRNSDLLMKAMRSGVKDFFTSPVKPEEVKEALHRLRKRKEHATRKSGDKKSTIISVAGSKGGVGATTIAVNLAAALAGKLKAQGSVALVDMNSLFGEIPLFLDMVPQFHWGDITRNIDRLDDTFLSNVLTRHASGVHVLPSPGYMDQQVSPDANTVERLFRIMKTMYDFIIIDLGQMADETYLKTIQLSDTILLIATQTLPCLTNTNKLIKSFVNFGFIENERVRVVLNRYVKKSDITLKSAAEAIEKELFFVFPNDYNTTMSAINNGKTLLEISPKSEIARSFIELMEKVSEGQPIGKEKKKWLFWG